MKTLIQKEDFFIKKTNLLYSAIYGFIFSTFLLFCYAYFNADSQDKKDLDKNILLDLLRKSEYEISMKPSYGAFINSQEMLKEVLQVVKKDKNLCMIGGMYKIFIDENGNPKQLICSEIANRKNNILSPFVFGMQYAK